jgi:small GTP-binding protein
MPEETIKKSVKITLFGDAAVGKTCLIKRYVENIFDDKYISTIGTKITKKVVNTWQPGTGKRVELTMMIWDIVGQKEFRHLLQDKYFEGTQGAIGVCDITQRGTFHDLEEWRQSICKVTGNIPIIFLGNKADMADKAMITETDLKSAIGIYIDCIGEDKLRDILVRGKKPYMFTSAKNGQNVENAFATLAEAMV